MSIGNAALGSFKEQNSRVREDSRSRRLKTNKFFYKQVYQAFRDGGDITFDEMRLHELGKEFKFPSIPPLTSVFSTRIETNNDVTIRFETTFSKGATLTRHSHSDCDEYISVPKGSDGMFLIISGTERDGTMDFIVLTEEEDGLLIPKGLIHQVSNIGKKKTKLIVDFKRI